MYTMYANASQQFPFLHSYLSTPKAWPAQVSWKTWLPSYPPFFCFPLVFIRIVTCDLEGLAPSPTRRTYGVATWLKYQQNRG